MTSLKVAPSSEAAAPPPVAGGRWSAHALATAAATGRGILLLPRHVTLLLFGALVVVLGITGAADVRYGLVLSTIYAIAILGNNAIASTLGELSLSSGAYLALGAYLAANSLEHHVNIFLTLLISIVGTGIVGAILAIPTIRLRGVSTALVTFALAYSIGDLATYLTSVTGGDQGKYLPSTLKIAGLTVSGSSTGMLVVSAVAMVIVGIIQLRLLHSRPGRIAISVGEAEAASAVFGTRVRAVKVAVWTWAAMLSGLAGALYGLAIGYVTASQWPVLLSIFVLAGGLIGGARSATGAWIGGLLVGGLPIWLQNVVPISTTAVVYGVILLIALLAGGKGLAGFGERLAVAGIERIRRTR